MEPPGFADKLSNLARQNVSLRSRIGESAGYEPASRDLRFQFRKISTLQIFVT